MQTTDDSRSGFLAAALGFEAGLGALALGLGWLLGQSSLETVRPETPLDRHLLAMTWGLAASLPMLGGLLLLDRFPIGPLRGLRRFVYTHLVPLFAPYSRCQLGLLAVAAGVGEEMLFRGLLQAGLARWIGPPWGVGMGLAVASLVFGLCHWVTPTYALLAGLIGVYLGGLFLLTDNLLAPITAHAVYDAIALWYLVKSERPAAGIPPEDGAEDPEDPPLQDGLPT